MSHGSLRTRAKKAFFQHIVLPRRKVPSCRHRNSHSPSQNGRSSTCLIQREKLTELSLLDVSLAGWKDLNSRICGIPGCRTFLTPSQIRREERYCNGQCKTGKRTSEKRRWNEKILLNDQPVEGLCQLERCRKVLIGRQRNFCSKICKYSVYYARKTSIQRLTSSRKDPFERLCQLDRCRRVLKGNRRKFCSDNCKYKVRYARKISVQDPTSSKKQSPPARSLPASQVSENYERHTDEILHHEVQAEGLLGQEGFCPSPKILDSHRL